MEGKALFKLTLAGWLALIGWVNPGWATDVADRCQQLYKNGQYGQAFPVCSKAAEQGVAEAQFSLGWMYGHGQGVQQDNAEAAKWFRKAAEQGYALTPFRLGVMYALGKGVRRDDAEAAKWFRKAAEQGNAQAQNNLGVMYAKGEGVLKSGAAAADWFYKAGLSFLKEGEKDNALRCVERIKTLETKLHLTVPNAFLADKLLAIIYEGGAANSSPAQEEKSEVKQGTVSFGTGWPVLGGFVVTNYHVVKGHEEFLLLLKDGQKIPAAIAAYDAANDLVLLKATELRKMPPALPLATRPARVGEKVFTIGYPHPTLMGAEPKLTNGIINSLTGVGNDPRTYQVSVPVQAGM